MHTYAGLLSLKLPQSRSGQGTQAALDHFKKAFLLDNENTVAAKYIEEVWDGSPLDLLLSVLIAGPRLSSPHCETMNATLKLMTMTVTTTHSTT